MPILMVSAPAGSADTSNAPANAPPRILALSMSPLRPEHRGAWRLLLARGRRSAKSTRAKMRSLVDDGSQRFELGLGGGQPALGRAQLRQRLALVLAGGAPRLLLEAGVQVFGFSGLGFRGGAVDLAYRQGLVGEDRAAFRRDLGETAGDENPLRHRILVVGVDVDDA